jgi:hypothetical protein
MGDQVIAECLDCHKTFSVDPGGGFFFHLLRYHQGIETIAGHCSCKGNFTLDAPPRCPNCRSARLSEGGPVMFYD